MKGPKSKRLLLAYYADDFTGSTDALESLARAGLKTALFLRPPSTAQLAKFPGLRAFGIVGGSRSMSPAEMARELPHAFKALKRSGAEFIHYKACSTFDSSPSVGSIGKAIELGRAVFGQRLTPLVVGFPAFGRHVVFGNLFARSGDSGIFRLDRHPMSRHPVTPMHEADLCLHLGRQTRLPMELIDILAIKQCAGGNLKTVRSALRAAAAKKIPPVVLFDILDASDLPIIGNFIARARKAGQPLFCVGSSGVGYALTAHWRASGQLKPRPADVAGPITRGQMIVVSGSCSPVTARQIGAAVKAGFAEVACDTASLADPVRAEAAVQAALKAATRALKTGRHVVFHTARGASDSRIREFDSIIRRAAGSTWMRKVAAARAALGRSVGRILELALQNSGARRVVICGGDTATEAGRALGIRALEFLAPAATGAPWCRVHAPGRAANGCELICKGGQVGSDDFLARLARAKP